MLKFISRCFASLRLWGGERLLRQTHIRAYILREDKTFATFPGLKLPLTKNAKRILWPVLTVVQRSKFYGKIVTSIHHVVLLH
jgi:hypothetical protein